VALPLARLMPNATLNPMPNAAGWENAMRDQPRRQPLSRSCLRKSIAVTVTVAGLIFPLVGCTPENPPDGEGKPAARPLKVAVGGNYDDAESSIKASGGEPFLCSYSYSLDPQRPFLTYSWHTLPNGMSVQLIADKDKPRDPLRITRIAICNSTMLFCCKGETWYSVKEVKLHGQQVELKDLAIGTLWEGERPEEQDKRLIFVHKGMRSEHFSRALLSAGIKELPLADEKRAELPSQGHWRRYDLGEARELLVQLVDEDGEPPRIAVFVVEATTEQRQATPGKRTRVECELLNLHQPLRVGWSWAFGEKWSWKPDIESGRVKSAGQAR